MDKSKTKIFGLLTLGSGILMIISEYLVLIHSWEMGVIGCLVFGSCTLIAGFAE